MKRVAVLVIGLSLGCVASTVPSGCKRLPSPEPGIRVDVCYYPEINQRCVIATNIVDGIAMECK